MSATESLPPALGDAVERFARECKPSDTLERVAVVTEAGELLPLENIHPDPAENFRVADREWIEALEVAALVAHSHPVDRPSSWTPSVSDQRSQIAQGKPWAIVPPDGVPFVFGHPDPSRPLIGRGFRFGVDDCFGLFRDAWTRWAGLELPNFARRWQWWKDSEPLFEQGIHRAGFAAIPAAEMQRGDGVLFKIRSEVFNHIGFIESPEKMIHHPGPARPFNLSHLSRRESLERWLELPHQFVRGPGS